MEDHSANNIKPCSLASSSSSSLPLDSNRLHEHKDNLIETIQFSPSKPREEVSKSTNAHEPSKDSNQLKREMLSVRKREDSRGSTDGSLIIQGDSGRERLKRHRVEVAGRVWIPDIWGQEELLKDWIDCSMFDASLVSNKIMSARTALVQEGRRTNSSGLRISNRC